MTEYEPLISDQRLIEATEPLRTKYPSLHDSDFFTYVEDAHPVTGGAASRSSNHRRPCSACPHRSRTIPSGGRSCKPRPPSPPSGPRRPSVGTTPEVGMPCPRRFDASRASRCGDLLTFGTSSRLLLRRIFRRDGETCS
jgi:hypothetical protein